MVKVRFAPSPTGYLHLGGTRTALFDWLWARHNKGKFILRLEDTDQARLVPEAVSQIKESLEWLGLKPDEVVTQSERLDIYKKQADDLLEKGALYLCWCSPKRLQKLREEAQKNKVAFKYDRYCLSHPQEPSEEHVLRFKIPESPKEVSWKDAVRGELSFKSEDLDDFVAIKSDGYPTYNFANVVDDHLMEISHVIRAEEFLSSTPKHILLYQAFGWDVPTFAHLPQVLAPDGKSKLSKRHGANSTLEYRDEGYLADAIINFLAQLGWNDGTEQEIYSRDELIEKFSLERVQKSPAVFDIERLKWMNGRYIRQMSNQDFLEASTPFIKRAGIKVGDQKHLAEVLQLIHERVKFLAEVPELIDFFFQDVKIDPKLLTAKSDQKTAAEALKQGITILENTNFTHNELEPAFRKLAENLNLKPGDLFYIYRVAMTGRTAAPGLFETMLVLGKDGVRERFSGTLKLIS